MKTPVPTYSTFRIKIKSFKPRLSDTLRLDEREVCLSIPKLPEAKFERLVSLSSAYFFLFWFVCSFCVFNLLHAFKPLALFTPSGKTVARYFGATSGLRVLCTLRPTQIRFSPKKEQMNKEIFSAYISQSKQRKKFFVFRFCTCHATMNGKLGWKPQPTVISDYFPSGKVSKRKNSVRPERFAGQCLTCRLSFLNLLPQ